MITEPDWDAEQGRLLAELSKIVMPEELWRRLSAHFPGGPMPMNRENPTDAGSYMSTKTKSNEPALAMCWCEKEQWNILQSLNQNRWTILMKPGVSQAVPYRR